MPGMAYPRRLLTSGEQIVREFHPHWKVLILPFLSTILAGVAVYLILDRVGDDEGQIMNGTVRLVLLGVVLILWLVYAVGRFINWRFTQYVLTNERMIVRSGIVSKHGKEIPLENINDVGFSQGILERLLRYGDVLIESAGEHGQSVLGDIPDPEGFHTELYRVREARGLDIGRAIESDPSQQLERLARLHKEGALTAAEFEEQKRKLLTDM